MLRVALKMLVGDPVKYFGLVFGVAFATLLIAQQTSIFVGLLGRAGAEVRAVSEATLWVMDPAVTTVADSRPLRDTMLGRVRGVAGIDWAVPLLRGSVALRLRDGRQIGATLVGVDDGTLIGGPGAMVLGSLESLREPGGIVIDEEGYKRLFPGTSLQLGAELEINDARAVIVGIAKTTPSFINGAVVHARYSTAIGFLNNGRNQLSFIIARERPGIAIERLCRAITEQTGLKALPSKEFVQASRDDVIQNTGIPISIATTDVLGVIVGIAIVALTFTIFVAENLRQFGALKAVGVSSGQLVAMVLAQAGLVGAMGYAIGLGVSGAFFIFAAAKIPTFQGFYLPVEVAALAALVVALIIVIAGLVAIRRVLVIDPAIVFRG